MSGEPSTDSGTDRISLRGLRVRGHHGVFEHERRDGQDFVVDLVLAVDTRPAAASDDLADTVDYGGVASGVAAIVAGEPVDLLETLAQRIADHVLAVPRVEAVEVTVHKPSAPIPLAFDDVTVSIHRRRDSPQSARPDLSSTDQIRHDLRSTRPARTTRTPGATP